MTNKTSKAAAKATGKSSKTKAKDDDEAYVQKGAKKTLKGTDDDNKVKRPTSAYFYYCNERRESLKKE